MTKQQTFDIVTKHLLTQNKKALGMGTNGRVICKYRGDDNTMCAAGCLISNEKYQLDFEGKGVIESEIAEIMIESGHSIKLVAGLQEIHDSINVEYWPEKLKLLADIHNLQYKMY